MYGKIEKKSIFIRNSREKKAKIITFCHKYFIFNKKQFHKKSKCVRKNKRKNKNERKFREEKHFCTENRRKKAKVNESLEKKNIFVRKFGDKKRFRNRWGEKIWRRKTNEYGKMEKKLN